MCYKILKLIYDYSINCKLVDCNFIDKLIEIVTNERGLETYVKNVAFTYVLVEDGESNQASYVQAWYFIATDNQLKDGDQRVEYTHVINAIDGSNLNDSLR